MHLDGASAIVTGGASGLGFATAQALAKDGAAVTLLDLPSSQGADAAREIGPGANFMAADVCHPEQVADVIDAAQQAGPLRVVVNCAGIATASRTVGRQGPASLDVFERTVRVNLIGTFNVTRLAAAAMSENEPGVGQVPDGPETPERGVIISTASIAAFDGQVGQAAYAASKGGVVSMTLPIARDLAGRLIRVVTIAPGIMRTPMMDVMPSDVQVSLENQIPHPSRMGTPAEYAAIVRHVVANPYINAETIRLDAGVRMQPK